MNAVMYGAGNIGRGFVGALLAKSGYAVTFIDISQVVINSLNERHCYPIRIVSSEGYEDVEVSGVNAIHGTDTNAVAEAIAAADILAVSVGANVLPKIANNISTGLRKRWAMTDAPLNILICENLMDADKILENLISDDLNHEERIILKNSVGFIETSIGRMVPVQTPDMQDGDPMRICVEQYDFLPIDKDAIKGEIPAIEKLVPFSPFGFYLRRKLYIHNMGHAVCAYLGIYTGQSFIYEAMADGNIHLIVKEAMSESMIALSNEYNIPMQEILYHIDDLLLRFTNRALKDTCARVGGDPARKLAHTDRLIGSALFCEKHGLKPVGIAVGIAGAIYQYLNEHECIQNDANAEKVMSELANLESNSELGSVIIEFYQMYRSGTSPAQLFQAIQNRKKQNTAEVV